MTVLSACCTGGAHGEVPAVTDGRSCVLGASTDARVKLQGRFHPAVSSAVLRFWTFLIFTNSQHRSHQYRMWNLLTGSMAMVVSSIGGLSIGLGGDKVASWNLFMSLCVLDPSVLGRSSGY